MTQKPDGPLGTSGAFGLFVHSLIIAAAVLALIALGYGLGEVMDRVFRPADDGGSVITWGSS